MDFALKALDLIKKYWIIKQVHRIIRKIPFGYLLFTSA